MLLNAFHQLGKPITFFVYHVSTVKHFKLKPLCIRWQWWWWWWWRGKSFCCSAMWMTTFVLEYLLKTGKSYNFMYSFATGYWIRDPLHGECKPHMIDQFHLRFLWKFMHSNMKKGERYEQIYIWRVLLLKYFN